MITLTDSAVQAVRTAIAGATDPIAGLRIMVETGGCAGLKYSMGLVGAIEPGDLAMQYDDLNLFIDPVSIGLLDGTVVDFITSDQGAGFVFNNPTATASCSCGKSFA